MNCIPTSDFLSINSITFGIAVCTFALSWNKAPFSCIFKEKLLILRIESRIFALNDRCRVIPMATAQQWRVHALSHV